MELFFRQVWTLTVKNLFLVLVRHPFSTPFRAFLLPCIFAAFLAYLRFIFVAPAGYGIGSPAPVRSLPDALDLVSPSRNKLVFVNNGNYNGDIDTVITDIQNQVDESSWAGTTEVLEQEDELLNFCQNSVRSTSVCAAGVVLYSSPDEGGRWNYSLRTDGALQGKIAATSHSNDVQIYLLPLQRAIDSAIARINGSSIPQVQEYAYTSETQAERNDGTRTGYMGGITNALGIAYFVGSVGITYHLTGMIATERETGMAQLLDCMMPNKKRWQPQFARTLGNHLAFDIIYTPGWLVTGIILATGVFTKTSAGIVIVFHLLGGLSLSSMSILGAAFFRRAQLSGITLVMVSIGLAIVAQFTSKSGGAAVAVLSALFPPVTYVQFIIFMARWESQNMATSLIQSAPESTLLLSGIVMWVFLIVQTLVFPILGAFVERALHGTQSKNRNVTIGDSSTAVSLRGFTRAYPMSFGSRLWAKLRRKPAKAFVAVNDLDLDMFSGQITVLLGANGSGKTTSLESIAGLHSITSGSIEIKYPRVGAGMGLCPQKNVLWDNLTVEEHIRIFNKLKSIKTGSEDENYVQALLQSCDIFHKRKAQSRTLSGGQKRKLQLAAMFVGGSAVCCIDEASSGLDPISRRKIWDILLAERGHRSILLTTHFLDEADLLADTIAVMSKGNLKAYGTSVELKQKLGSGYRVHVYQTPGGRQTRTYNLPHTNHRDQTVYLLSNSADTALFLAQLEKDGVIEYQVSGPTIEDVFLKVAEEIRPAPDSDPDSPSDGCASSVALVKPQAQLSDLQAGRGNSIHKEMLVFLQKRWTILRRNRIPYIVAFALPIIGAALASLLMRNFEKASCDPLAEISVSPVESLSSLFDYQLAAGPSIALTPEAIRSYTSTIGNGTILSGNFSQISSSLKRIDTLTGFHEYIQNRYANVTPGGFFLNDNPTIAWQGDGDISFSMIMQNALHNFLLEVPITTQYQAFDIPEEADIGTALQFMIYLGLVMSVYPAFFALYPTIERLRNVRGLHYSNGARAAPLWTAYTIFDAVLVLVTSAIAVCIFQAKPVWYHLEYLFVVLLLYGLAATLLSYNVSLVARSQLSAFAIIAGGQVLIFLIYLIASLSVFRYAAPDQMNQTLSAVYFPLGLISPVVSLTRALLVSLNLFSVTCDNAALATYAGSITLYGGPILYLTLQIIILFGVLVWWEAGFSIKRLRFKNQDPEEKNTLEMEVTNESTRVMSSKDGLRVVNISKSFKDNLAVDNVTFGVTRGEVFALLGPNGAGKSTLISLIRGDIKPSQRGGDIIVEDISVLAHRAQARLRLGVCPQFDAMDRMTVTEHLEFYARIRGVANPKNNVQVVIHAVGLEQYANRLAERLSGGNKRKLSLGIALMGNPSVLLLDEPSSGMDAASKRVMWRTLEAIIPGRSLVLTTHSMEEADALASRAGILASRMLAIGTTEYLRRTHGDGYYVHIVHQNAPHSSAGEMNEIRTWAQSTFRNAEVEQQVFGGQLRFTLPTSGPGGSESKIAALFRALEGQRRQLGIAHYSASRATLDQVFLSIVGKHRVGEEDGPKIEEGSGK